MTENGQKPCSVKWCAALATIDAFTKRDDLCVAHATYSERLHPQEYKRPRPARHWPPTPWDDEIPWWEIEPCR